MPDVYDPKDPAKRFYDSYPYPITSDDLVRLTQTHVKHIQGYRAYKVWVFNNVKDAASIGEGVIRGAWSMIQNARRLGIV